MISDEDNIFNCIKSDDTISYKKSASRNIGASTFIDECETLKDTNSTSSDNNSLRESESDEESDDDDSNSDSDIIMYDDQEEWVGNAAPESIAVSPIFKSLFKSGDDVIYFPEDYETGTV